MFPIVTSLKYCRFLGWSGHPKLPNRNLQNSPSSLTLIPIIHSLAESRTWNGEVYRDRGAHADRCLRGDVYGDAIFLPAGNEALKHREVVRDAHAHRAASLRRRANRLRIFPSTIKPRTLVRVFR
jgi:hypothetical protein